MEVVARSLHNAVYKFILVAIMGTQSPVSAQWALDVTVGSTLSVTMGLIKAASSDNIQALALLACEAFGSTLAICPETCIKVERIAGMHHQSVVVKFLKSQVGYSSGDSGAQLSLSTAGVRFLALSAALCSFDAFQGAVALELMIKNSARDSQFLPTVIQLKDLLIALDHKLNRAGFVESLVGWTTWLENNPLLPDGERQLAARQHPPSPAEVCALVHALREIGRLGDAIQVTITSTLTVPWATAFIKWSLGMPPSIRLQDGTPVLEQPGSAITLIVARSVTTGMKVEISRDIGTPAEIIDTVPARQGEWAGMVSIRTFAQQRLRQLDLHAGLTKQAVVEALPNAVRQAVSLLRPDDLSEYEFGQKPSWKGTREKYSVFDPNLRNDLPTQFVHIAGSMFPDEAVLSNVLSEFLDVDITAPLPILPHDTLFTGLPSVQLLRESVENGCNCVRCKKGSQALYATCAWTRVEGNLHSLVADVLALSLFDSTEPVLLYHKRWTPRDPQPFEQALRVVLSEGKPALCCVEGILEWALTLVGHEMPPFKRESWVMSSYRGQVFYPRLFETQTLDRQGLLTLSGAPGILRFEGSTYSRAVSPRSDFYILMATPIPIASKLTIPVDRSINLLADHSTKWRVTIGDNQLYVSLLSTMSTAGYSPFAVICSAVKSLYIETCSHHPDDVLPTPDVHAAYTSPFFPWGEGPGAPTKLGVVPVHGNEGLRMFCLAHGIPGVVQQSACLACALDICRQSKYPFVISGTWSRDRL